ncbi:MAG: bifunctional diguanylate cyclase/phosphodiesterase [Eubacterium sp.]|nr:bifunctional diguanylate cyclase/phosphodiesterase [Eubacterium sp.]
MGNRVCSENYKKFIRGIDNSNFTLVDIIDYTRKSIQLIAGDLHIGRLEAIVDAYPNVIDRVGYRGRELLFQAFDGYDPDLYSMEFQTGGGVSITMNAYPEKGYVWTEEEKDDLQFVCGNFFNLFEKARSTSILKRAAVTDSQTGATNITGLLKYAGKLKSENSLGRYTIAFMNIKNFKYINKSMGVAQGDKVLMGFVDKLYGFIMPDERITRLGGDNFLALLRDERVKEFIKFISPLVLTTEMSGKRESLEIFFRVGIYDIDDEIEFGDAITNGNTALAASRKEGNGDIVWFNEEMQKDDISHKKTSFMFAQALANREFVVYYQPKVTLEDNKLCGCEALARWIREGEVIPPISFIPALEHDGSICNLDFYIFENVCSDIRQWITDGIDPVTVSVNFSKYHLRNSDFEKRIIAIIERYGIDPKYIEIELTESACYEDMDRLKEFIKNMKYNNIKVSIDDFGTGYSSLGLLKDLKVNVIKIDQSFVRGLDTPEMSSESDMIVLRNVIKMIRELDMKVIAEGVETSEEADFLKGADCVMAQGFLFDKPMPRDEYELVLKGKRTY